MPDGLLGGPPGQPGPARAPQVAEQRQQGRREHQQHVEEPQVRGVEPGPARGPVPLRQQPGRDGRDIPEGEPEPPVRLVESGLREVLEIEHRRHQQHQAGGERDPQPAQPLGGERPRGAGPHGVAHAHARDQEQQRHAPQRPP